MLTSLPSRALVIFGLFARATIILVMMAMAASAASFCPTAQAPCHMMNDDGQDVDQSICLLACGVLLEADSDSHDLPSHPLQVTRDHWVRAIGGLDVEPDVPPPRVSV